MTQVTMTINGRRVQALVEPRTHLGDFLREARRLTGTHLGCEHGVCGACTVLLDGEPVRSCITYTVACEGREVRTIEGFEDDALMASLRAAFSREHGLQCGFCTAGMLIAARDICLRKPNAVERDVRTELSGNLCRCTGYVGIVNAVTGVIAERRCAEAASVQQPARAAAPLAAFVPIAQAAAPVKTAAPTSDDDTSKPFAAPGGMRIDEAVVIPLPREAVWRFLSDIAAAAACLPGAEVVEHDDRSVKGRVQVKFGPMSAAFSGAAGFERDDPNFSGTMRGAGVDSLSKTRARGELVYRVVPVDDGAGSRIEIGLSYVLVGPLAQFSRSGLVKDFANRLMVEFARNLKDRIEQPEAPVRKAELRAGALMVSVLWRRLKRLFRLSA